MELTNREAGIAYAIYSGMQNKQIADFYGISSQTIKTCVTNLLDKIGLPDRTNIALWWWKYALGDAEPVYTKTDKKLLKNSISNKKYAVVRRTVSKQQWLVFLAQNGNKCLCCGSDYKITKDHVIPLSKGGSSGLENIQPLCVKCNSKETRQ